MRYLSTAMIGTVALLSVHCTDGSVGVPVAGSGGATGAGTGGAVASGGANGSGGSGSGSGGASASGGSTGVSGGATGNSGGATGSGGSGTATGGSGTASGGATGTGGAGTASGGATGTGGAGTGGAAGGSTGLRAGPFKILVMSTSLEFGHDSIPTCFKMLQDLGKATAPERAKITGLGADTTWTVDQMGSTPSAANYFSEVTADNLKNYEMFYSNNPTGPVFTRAPEAAQKKMIFQDWWTNGGAWAGQHSASDFEKTNGGSWNWWHDNIDGAYFVDHDNPNTNGTITWQPEYVNHPIVKGLPSPYSSGEEWYLMNRNVEAVTGFKVLGKVQVTNSSKGTTPRPAVWINENPKGGRAFYTVKGHSQSTYSEAAFRDMMLRGILWAVHRLPGGN